MILRNSTMLPDVGPTGSKVIRGTMSIQSGMRIVHYLRPGPPDREDPVYDDDGEVVDYLRLTDAEFARRMAAFERASAEWHRTNGMARVREAPDTYTCQVTCEDGTTAEAVGDGEVWRWVSFANAPKNATLDG